MHAQTYRFLTIVARLAAVAAVVTTLAGLGAAPASAGTYTVYNCRLPNGDAASVADWTMERTRSTTSQLTSSCGSGGPLTMQLTTNASHPADDAASLYFRAPADTAVVGVTLYRSVQLAPDSHYSYWFENLPIGTPGYQSCHTVYDCTKLGDPAQPFGTSNLFTTSGNAVGAFRLNLTCGQPDDSGVACPPKNPAAILRLHRMQVTLNDGSLPTFDAAPHGGLLNGGKLSGVQRVTISASDRGAGVYRASLEVDGRVVAGGVLDDDGGRCREPFTRARPCLPQADGELALDTAELSDGEHLLRVLVTDATGSNRAEWGPVRILTDNVPDRDTDPERDDGRDPDRIPEWAPGPMIRAGDRCDPQPRVDALGLSIGFRSGGVLTTTLVRRYDGRSELRGRLRTPIGAPVAGARVCIAAREDRPGAPLFLYGETTTGSDGAFAYPIPEGPSRRVLAIHRTDSGAVVAVARVAVRAQSTLTPSRRRLRNGERIVLRGRLAHGPVPARGVLVQLQARHGQRWQTFGTTRTRPDGRFRYPYRFTDTTRTRRYALRALVVEQAAYPYARGASRPTRVLVHGG